MGEELEWIKASWYIVTPIGANRMCLEYWLLRLMDLGGSRKSGFNEEGGILTFGNEKSLRLQKKTDNNS